MFVTKINDMNFDMCSLPEYDDMLERSNNKASACVG